MRFAAHAACGLVFGKSVPEWGGKEVVEMFMADDVLRGLDSMGLDVDARLVDNGCGEVRTGCSGMLGLSDGPAVYVDTWAAAGMCLVIGPGGGPGLVQPPAFFEVVARELAV